jgi:hypothetical protein
MFFFLKKYSDSQCCWTKYSDFGGEKQKSDSEFLSYNLMLNSWKKIFNSCLAREKNKKFWTKQKTIQNQCIRIGFFLKPSILIMKVWQVLHMHNFFLSLLIVFYTNWCPELRAGCLSGYNFQYREREGPSPHCSWPWRTINSINIQPRLNKQDTIKYILAFI